MRLFTITLAIILALSFNANSQNNVISKFTWDNSSATTADVGPDATSISSSAKSSNGGSNGSKGLNPSLPKKNVDLILPGSYFNVDGIEISFEFKRKESQANFFTRGGDFKIAMNGGKLSVKYKVEDANGANKTGVNSGNAYTIPQDDQFHTYTFTYDAVTGIGTLKVDGSQVWTNDGPDGYVLSWSVSNDVEIGSDLDAGGSDVVVLDNFIVEEVPNASAALPITLEFFNGEVDNNEVLLSWATASETNNAYFTVERSVDQVNWEVITIIPGAGTSNEQIVYNAVDANPVSGVNYYRLSQTDFDGTEENFEVISVIIENNTSDVKMYPNPATNVLNIDINNLSSADVQIYSLSGELVKSTFANQQISSIDISDCKTGFYFVKVISGQQMVYSQKLIVK